MSEHAYIPEPLEIRTPLDRIQITKDGWLRLWNSQRPEQCIEVKTDPTAENRIDGLSFHGLGKQGEGITVPIDGASNVITGNTFDDSDGLHIDSEGVEPFDPEAE